MPGYFAKWVSKKKAAKNIDSFWKEYSISERKEQVKKTVSVVIPSYNHAPYLKAAIESALQQTEPCLEIIVVDDGSKDNSVEICQDYQRQYDNKLRFFSQKNQGAHKALNKGIQEASGEYIAVLNSDDVFLPRKLERCQEVLHKNPQIELVSGKIEAIDEAGVVQTSGITVDWQQRSLDFYRQSKNLPLSLLNENFITTTSNIVFSKRLWEEFGGFQALRYCHDWDFILAALLRKKVYYDMCTAHIQYRVHSYNTIAEDLAKIKVEIAGVMAVYLVEFKMHLLEKDDVPRLRQLKQVLRTKNILELVIALMMLYLETGNRERFYEIINQNETKMKYICLLD